MLGRKRLPEGLRHLPGRARDLASFLQYTGRRFNRDNCYQTASALTYTSLLALVPLLTIVFAIFSAFPAFEALQQQAQTILFNALVPQVGETLQQYIDQFMRNAGQLTGFGVLGLAFTAVLLLWTIDSSFSAIWRATEPRPLVIRLLAFWAILTLPPLLFGASLSLSTNLLAQFRWEEARDSLPWLVILPGLFELLGFTLLYIIVPNRSVRWHDALIGGAVAALLLELSKAGFGWYMTSFPVYQTIYGALSVIPIFLFWLYIAWSTVLVGAEIAAALPEWRAGRITEVGPEGLLPSQRHVVALALLHELQEASHYGIGLQRYTLVKRVPVGSVVVDGVLELLAKSHWVVRTGKGSWVVSRDLAEATLYDLTRALGFGLRGPVRPVGVLPKAPWQERAAALLDAAERGNREILDVPLKELFGMAGGEREAVRLRAPAGRSG